jgi:hypothetical protein
MTVKQVPFEWQQPGDADMPSQVVLDVETTTTVIALMASAVVAVVRGATQVEETADER